MEGKGYTVSELARIAGISTRALRYYDEIGLLEPKRGANGYRTYGQREVRSLQHIMLLRSCGLPLSDVADVISDEGADFGSILRSHLAILEEKSDEIASCIATTKKMIDGLEGFESMNDEEVFEQLKRDSINCFEEEFGEEARRLYGDDAVDQSNERMLAMNKTAWDEKEELEQRVKDALIAAMGTGDPASPESRTCAELHARWIRAYWGDAGYSPNAHIQLARGYTKDLRFVEYYDGPCGEGATEFLGKVIAHNVA